MAAQDAHPLLRGQPLVSVAARMGEWVAPTARAFAQAAIVGLLVGGVVVAPVLAILALVGLLAPQLEGAHQAAPALIVASLLWLALAIFGAHAEVGRHITDDADLH